MLADPTVARIFVACIGVCVLVLLYSLYIVVRPDFERDKRKPDHE